MGVFICYRRDDAEGEARALFARLAEETDERNLFLDHDAIGAGENWRGRIDEALKKVDVVLVVIGPRWLEILKQREASGDSDTVRHEIASSLARPNLQVIPVTVKGAYLPSKKELPADIRPLVDRNAKEVRGSAWKDDTAGLVETLREAGALPTPRRRWIYRGVAALVLIALTGAFSWVLVRVPEIPVSMTKQDAQQRLESRGLRFQEHQVQSARFQGYIIEAVNRGIPVASGQRPGPGKLAFRGQTVEVDIIVREPYRLVCKGGGSFSNPSADGTFSFEKHPGLWSLDMVPGSCSWLSGPIVENQLPVLKPIGFADKLPERFKKAPNEMLVFCAYSEYDHPNAKVSERLAALNSRQFLSPDDYGKLNPTVAGHVCDERL